MKTILYTLSFKSCLTFLLASGTILVGWKAECWSDGEWARVRHRRECSSILMQDWWRGKTSSRSLKTEEFLHPCELIFLFYHKLTYLFLLLLFFATPLSVGKMIIIFCVRKSLHFLFLLYYMFIFHPFNDSLSIFNYKRHSRKILLTTLGDLF